jgi:hypothetical protein
MRWDKKELLLIFEIKKGKQKKIASLKSLLFRKRKGEPTEISFVDLLKVIVQNRRSKEKNAFSFLNKKSRFQVLIQVALGAGDAYYTGMLCGWAAALGSSLCAAFSRKKKNFRISVKPEFNRQSFSLHADCIIAIKPANIILGYFIYKNKARRQKNASD